MWPTHWAGAGLGQGPRWLTHWAGAGRAQAAEALDRNWEDPCGQLTGQELGWGEDPCGRRIGQELGRGQKGARGRSWAGTERIHVAIVLGRGQEGPCG